MIELKQKREMNEFALQGVSSSSSPSAELLVSVPPNVRKLRIANEKKIIMIVTKALCMLMSR
jgi:hypothetical protein